MKTQQKSVHKKLIRALVIVLLLLAILAGAFFWYVSDYYRAEDVALEVLAQNDGIITQDNLTILSPSYQSNTAIIFYPGAKVEAEAYLPLLDQIRQTGITCILVDMPFHMAIFDSDAAEDVMTQFPEIEHWYLAGHSMGGAIASELAKLYPDVIKKMVLWAPAFNLPDALHYLTGQVERAKTYDHGGYEISDDFVEDILKRDFYQELDTYQNDLLVIHGTKDTTVPYEISNKYMKLFHKGTKFISIEDGNHNFDKLSDIKQVLKLTLDFFE